MTTQERPREATPRPRLGQQRECQAATVQEQPRGDTPHPRSGAVAGRSYLLPDASGCDQEELPHVQGAMAVRAQEGLGELLHIKGQEGWW